MKTLKVLAITRNEGHYDWAVMVELDRSTFAELNPKDCRGCPNVGHELDISQTIERMRKLEVREARVKGIQSAILDIVTEAEAGEKEER